MDFLEIVFKDFGNNLFPIFLFRFSRAKTNSDSDE